MRATPPCDADVGRNALERHHGDGAGLLGDLRLVGVDHVHDHAALQHLCEAALDPHRPGLGHRVILVVVIIVEVDSAVLARFRGVIRVDVVILVPVVVLLFFVGSGRMSGSRAVMYLRSPSSKSTTIDGIESPSVSST